MKHDYVTARGLLFGLLTLASGAAFADNAAILKCRATTDAVKRLACYDAIDVAAPTVAKSAPSPAPAATAPAARAAAVAAAPTSAPAAAPAGPAAEFGMPPKQTAVGVDRIETTIKGHLDGWSQGKRIRLANGTLWQVTDDSRGVCDCTDRKVVVTRGAFGTYFLEIEGKGNAPRVKRIE